MDDLNVLIYNLTVNGSIFADICTRKDDTVAYYSAFLDHASTSDYGMLDGTFDQTPVGYNGVLYIRGLEVLSRAGVVCPCVDGPILIVKQAGSRLQIDQRQVSVIETLKICNGSEEASVGNTAYILRRHCSQYLRECTWMTEI